MLFVYPISGGNLLKQQNQTSIDQINNIRRSIVSMKMSNSASDFGGKDNNDKKFVNKSEVASKFDKKYCN